MQQGEASIWPEAGGRRIVFLAEAASGIEERLLGEWIERAKPAGTARSAYEVVPIPSWRRQRRKRQTLDPRLEAAIAALDDPLLAPLRVVWNAAKKGEPEREVGFSELLTFGDPRDPGRLRQRIAVRREPRCYEVLPGEPAPFSDLRARWRAVGEDPGETTGLAEFIARQASLALERAERRRRGARYKVPRFVAEEILARPAFRGALSRLARDLGLSVPAAERRAAKNLAEIAATHSPSVIDLVARAIRVLYRQAYDEVRYDARELERVYALSQRHPVVFLPSHKSNLDHLVLQSMLHENGHPPNHTAGGINMNFFPIGPLVRRSGTFFIRRSFKDDALYKLVLRSYIDYLIEKRFSLEWYIEGGRSRSGKLLPPRFGLLAYVADAYERGKSEDVILLPVSIAYDQIQDVGSYVAEQRGAKKESESFGWFVKLVRSLRPAGDIHIRLGEPLSLRETLGPPEKEQDEEAETDERSIALQKIAFEVAVRINRATPITPTSLVTLALLGFGEKAADVDEVRRALVNLVAYVRSRQLPTTVALDFDENDGVARALDSLVESGVVFRFAEGADPVYAIRGEQALTAAYYRNTIIHFFLTSSILELSLLRAAEVPPAEAAGEFEEEAFRLRDLLKFEFFFPEKEAYRAEVLCELALHAPDFEKALRAGGERVRSLVLEVRPFLAHRVLRPFLEAYRVVGDLLARHDPMARVDEARVLSQAMALGRQYHLQRRVHSLESVSRVLFQNALALARNRGLLAEPAEILSAARRVFASDLREALRRVDAIEALAASRRAGMIR